MFSCDYCKIFKITHFEKQLRAAASVYGSWKRIKAWFPPMGLTYSRKNKLISLMRLLVDRIKIFNLIRSHKISQISHFRIKNEHSVSHFFTPCVLCFFPIFFFIPFVTLVIKVGKLSYLLRNPFFFFQIRFNHICKTARIYLDHHFIVC